MYAAAKQSKIIEIIQTLNDEQLSYLFNVVKSLPRAKASRPKCSLRGRFSAYANSSLRKKEKEAWAIAAEEKHGLR